MTDSNYIFISYGREDIAFVGAMSKDLRENGINLWTDVSSLPGGANWPTEIAAAITQCQAFILVLSPDAVASDYVARELNLAAKNQRKIIPIICRETEIPAQLELNLSGIHRLDFNNADYDNNLRKLLNALK